MNFFIIIQEMTFLDIIMSVISCQLDISMVMDMTMLMYLVLAE